MNDSIASVNSIFEQPWWLEAVAPGQWDAVQVEKDGKIIARLPYIKKRRFGIKILSMPEYTQTLGYWIEDTGAKNTKKYARNKDLISELIEQLPKGYCVDLELDHSCNYLFPFKWKGFSLQIAYSYRIEDIHDTQILWDGLADNIRREIKKAQKTLKIEDDHSIEDLILMQSKTFERQGRNCHNSDELIRRIDEALANHNARKLLCAVDDDGRIHAACYFIYDSKCCYYLIGGGDPELRNSGASSLLMWEGIKFASTVSESFDFEGSMIESIERFFRAFGGKPIPYWHITKYNFILSLIDYMKPKIKRIIGWK